MTRPMTIIGAALFAALLTPSFAFAATATSTVNVRSAPVNGPVVDVLRAGQQVDVDRCTPSGWCYVTKPGPDGWVSAAFLSNDEGDDDDDRGPPSRPDRPGRPDADVSIGFAVPGFSFQMGNGGFDRPGRPGGHRPGGPGSHGERDQACFYERSNFRGDSFCADPGDRIARLGRWDDEIGSIRIRGDAEALVCQDEDFDGRCVVVTRDVRDLGPASDQISSIRVR